MVVVGVGKPGGWSSLREKGPWPWEMGQFSRRVRQEIGTICYESSLRIRVDHRASFPWVAVHEILLNATPDPVVDRCA